jgi:hypothetical protein
MSDPPEDDDGKRWDLPPEYQWVEVQFLGVAKLYGSIYDFELWDTIGPLPGGE